MAVFIPYTGIRITKTLINITPKNKVLYLLFLLRLFNSQTLFLIEIKT